MITQCVRFVETKVKKSLKPAMNSEKKKLKKYGAWLILCPAPSRRKWHREKHEQIQLNFGSCSAVLRLYKMEQPSIENIYAALLFGKTSKLNICQWKFKFQMPTEYSKQSNKELHAYGHIICFPPCWDFVVIIYSTQSKSDVQKLINSALAAAT